MRPSLTALAAMAAAGAVLLASCGGSGGPPAGSLQHLGGSEGSLDLVALPGYVEDGSRDPAADWVTPFERRTGCQVTSTVASSPDRVLALMRSGNFDGVAARGDVSGSLVADHLVSPVNTALLPSYAGLFPAVKRLPSNKVDGVTYGIPTGRFANFLVWRTDLVSMPHREEISSNVLFDPEVATRYRGRLTAYDNPMSIADAALYLRKHNESLGIGDPYELDREQFAAVIRLLQAQRPLIGSYWRSSEQNAANFARGVSIAGPAWQPAIDRMLVDRLKIKAALPKERGTGISDAWMISSHARHPNCMYMWMDYMSTPAVNAALAEHTGQAPASEHACDLTAKPSFCDTYRAADEGVFGKVHFWHTPLRDCGDDRGESCMDYAEWARGWREVTGE